MGKDPWESGKSPLRPLRKQFLSPPRRFWTGNASNRAAAAIDWLLFIQSEIKLRRLFNMQSCSSSSLRAASGLRWVSIQVYLT